MLEARAISLTLGRRTILSEVSLRAAPGEVTAVVGPNGAGKSMLFSILTGERSPDAGRVFLDEADIDGIRPTRLAERRAVLSQASALAFPFTVYEVVRLGLRDAPAAGQAAIIGQALARVDLTGFGGRFFQELSGGERQRVHLARAMVQVWRPVVDGVPRYLLLDEPTNNLDLKHQFLSLQCARTFADMGGGVLAILHDLNLAAAYADRVAVLKDGRIVACGVPAEIVTREMMTEVFEVRPQVVHDRRTGQPLLLPEGFDLPRQPEMH